MVFCVQLDVVVGSDNLVSESTLSSSDTFFAGVIESASLVMELFAEMFQDDFPSGVRVLRHGLVNCTGHKR